MSLRIILTELDRPLDLSEVAEHRNLDCGRYDKCLDKAIRKDWESFSCQKCPRFKADLKKEKKVEERNWSAFQGGCYEEGFI